MQGTCFLFFRKGERLLQLRLDRTEVLVGSAPTNDVMVPDQNIPEVAARLTEQNSGTYRLDDLSEGYIKLNGQSMLGAGAEFNHGDEIQLGQFSLRLDAGLNGEQPRSRRTQQMEFESLNVNQRNAWLIYQQQRYELSPNVEYSVGSEIDNDLVLQDAYISAYHFKIIYNDGRWQIRDLHSTNGTQVNGLNIRSAELRSGVPIDLGQTRIRFYDQLPPSSVSYGLVAESKSMQRVFHLVERFADSLEPVLVLGESGTGKEGVARAIHSSSCRSNQPYLALNCGALAASIIESELFGHVKGAFTGATLDKKGAFEAASGGTLFLDEVGELPLELQPKLLRVLETQTIRRVGSNHEQAIQTRIVAATHQNLREAVEEGRFREDLFHRLFVLSIPIPPLRDRPEDIRALIQHFLSLDDMQPSRELSEEAMLALLGYSWPGNVRELRNMLVRAFLTSESQVIKVQDLQFLSAAFTSKPKLSIWEQSASTERSRILAALEQVGGNRAAAARALGISKSTFYDRLKRLGIETKS